MNTKIFLVELIQLSTTRKRTKKNQKYRLGFNMTWKIYGSLRNWQVGKTWSLQQQVWWETADAFN